MTRARDASDSKQNDTATALRTTELGEFPIDWEVLEIGDVLEEVDVRAADENGALGYDVLSLTKHYGLISQTERFNRRIARSDVSDYKVVRPGWIVYNPYVIWEGAIHGLIGSESGLVSPVYVTWKAVNANALFLHFVFRQSVVLDRLSMVCSGTVNRRRSISRRDFRRVKIAVPPLHEQHAIAHILRIALEAKEATEQVIAAAHALKRSAMRYLFTYGPVPIRDADRVEVKETEIGVLPEEWDVVALEQCLIQAQYGLSVRGEQHGRVPMLRMNNLVEGRVTTRHLQYINLDDAECERFRLRPGDLLFNRTNSIDLVGKTAIFDLPGSYVFASYLIRLVAGEDRLIPSFLNYFLNWEETQRRLKMIATRGVSQSNISAGKLKKFIVALPPAPDQHGIVAVLDVVDAKIIAEKARHDAAEQLFESLLHDLMAGRIRLNEIWRVVAR